MAYAAWKLHGIYHFPYIDAWKNTKQTFQLEMSYPLEGG